MSYQVEISKEQRIARAKEALQSARQLRRAERLMGVDAICQFVKDVDGDWLENWDDITDIEIKTGTIKRSVSWKFRYFPTRILWRFSGNNSREQALKLRKFCQKLHS